MTVVDMILRGGQVINADSMFKANIGITGGVITQIGGELQAEEVIDVTGKLLFPGGIDAHVHLSSPPDATGTYRWVDDFTSGSAAALAGGITTIGNMTFPTEGETPMAALEREGAVARAQTIADVFLHPVLEDLTPAVLDEVPRLLDAGCNTIKVFTIAPQFDAQIDGYVQAIQRARDGGLLTLVHCEDRAMIDCCRVHLAEAGRASLFHYPASAPVITEVVATQRAVALAELLQAPVYIVHLSSHRALEVCVEAQSRSIPVYVETRPLYLHLTRDVFEGEQGPRYTGRPPLREQEDVHSLWAGIAQGVVHTVCSDHAPWSLAAKMDPDHTILNLRAGVENLQFLRPMLYSEGVRGGKISLSRFVEVTATNAAKLFGLYPRKGAIAVGGDADIAVFDPDLTRTITPAMMKSNADYSVYEGWEVTGWPVLTLRRGEIVFCDDEVLGQPGSGKLVKRNATEFL
jgi:dihydropyrimidinase